MLLIREYEYQNEPKTKTGIITITITIAIALAIIMCMIRRELVLEYKKRTAMADPVEGETKLYLL